MRIWARRLIVQLLALVALPKPYASRLPRSGPGASCRPLKSFSPCRIDTRNYGQVASSLASAKGEIILSTLSFANLKDSALRFQLEMTENFAFHLGEVGRLSNTLILSQDIETCTILQNSSIPCFVDVASPRPEVLPGMNMLQPTLSDELAGDLQ